MANLDTPSERHFTQFRHPTERSSLLARQSNAVDKIPSVEELGAIENELKRFQALGNDRTQTADKNLNILDRLVRRMAEKKAQKVAQPKMKMSKDKDKARRGLNVGGGSGRATSSVPSDAGDAMQIDSLAPPVASTSAAAARPKLDGSTSKDKKKKRRRESQGLEEDPDLRPPPAQKPRKASPALSVAMSQTHTPHPAPQASTSHKSKHALGQPKTNAAGFRLAEDFALPNRSYIPARPKIFPPLPPGPRHVTDVNDDFANMKAPSKQEPIHTFHSSVEPYMRPIREEDLALLDYDGDQDDPFLIPALGRHYLEVWEEEDSIFEGRERREGVAPPRPAPPPATNWNQSMLNETDMMSEQHGLGPLAERVLSGLLARPPGGNEVDPGLEPVGAGGKAPTLTAAELEERYLKELQNLGLFLPGEEPDLANAEDDQIVSELRTCQRLLRDQMQINHSRKARLLEIATDRVAYQEYLDNKESIERNLCAAFAKLQKPRAPPPPSSHKKKKAQAKNEEPAGPQPHPAVSGLTLTTDGHLHVPQPLKKFVDVRTRWVEVVGSQLEAKEREVPGTYWGLPQTSVYEALQLPKDPDPGKRAR